MTISLDKLPVNTALALLIDPHFPRQNLLSKFTSDLVTKNYDLCMTSLEKVKTKHFCERIQKYLS